MKIAYFDCFSGISGDMAIGAFLDAGLSMRGLFAELKKLKLKGYKLKSRKTKRGGITGTKFDCIVTDRRHNHRPLNGILSLIDKSSLNARVKSISKEIFENIGKAEALIHGITAKSEIRLHELGDIDSIIDIVGVAIAIDKLGIDEVYSSNVNMARAFVKTAHGNFPTPAPAALELLKGVSVDILDIDSELVTPTGAGILKTLAKGFGRMPRMNISAIGYGAGSRKLEEIPNMLRVMIGEAVRSFKEDSVLVVETNLDDMNPQHFEYLFEKLFSEGALDVYTTAIQMKKSRPAFKLSVICERPNLDRVSSVILKETTTIGLRFYEAGRFKLERRVVKAKTRYGEVRVKLSSGPDGIAKASPEHEDCVRLARSRRLPLRVIYEAAVAAAK